MVRTFFELAASINGNGAFRLDRTASSLEDIRDFVKSHPGENLYFSVYRFRETNKDKTIYDSAIVDKLFLELDGENHSLLNEDTWRDLQKILDWCRKESLPDAQINPQIFFSGRSGYHLIFNLPYDMMELRNDKVVKKLVEKLKALTGSRFIDLAANKGFSQLRRIPNTINVKTGLYCIPLTFEEAYNYPPNKIMEMAKSTQRTVETADSTYFVSVIKHLEKLIKEAEASKEGSRRVYRELYHPNANVVGDVIHKNNLERLRPCIYRLATQENLSFSESTWVATEMIRLNFDDAHIIQYFKGVRKEKFDYELTKYHLGKLREKGIHAPSCSFLEEKGYCKKEYHGAVLN